MAKLKRTPYILRKHQKLIKCIVLTYNTVSLQTVSEENQSYEVWVQTREK